MFGTDSCECIFMSFWKTMALRIWPWHFTQSFKRYIDDIFVIFLCQSHLNDFVNYMNTKHLNIKFSWIWEKFNLRIWEFEKNDSFSFLDVKFTRSNNQLTVFRKATFCSVFTNFKSFILVAYKFGLVYTLLHRSFSVYSSYESFIWRNSVIKGHFQK